MHMILSNSILFTCNVSQTSFTKQSIVAVPYFIHPTDGHSWCSYFIYRSNPAINILTHRSLHADVFTSVRKDSKYATAGSYGIHVPNFHQNCLLSLKAAPVHTPHKSLRVAPNPPNGGCYQSLQHELIEQKTSISLFFNLHFPDHYVHWGSFHMFMIICTSYLRNCLFTSFVYLWSCWTVQVLFNLTLIPSRPRNLWDVSSIKE